MDTNTFTEKDTKKVEKAPKVKVKVERVSKKGTEEMKLKMAKVREAKGQKSYVPN